MKMQIFDVIQQGILLSFKDKTILGLIVLYSILRTIFTVLAVNPLIKQNELNETTYPQALPVFGLYEILTIFISSAVSYFFLCVVAKIVFENLNKREISVSDAIVSVLKKIIPLFIATTIFYVIILLGIIALIIPGIFLAVALFFYSYAVLLNNKGIIDSFKESYNIVKGNWWRIFTLYLIFFTALVLVSFLSGFFLGFLLFISIIIDFILYFITGITIVIYTIIYFQLIEKEKKAGEDARSTEIV